MCVVVLRELVTEQSCLTARRRGLTGRRRCGGSAPPGRPALIS